MPVGVKGEEQQRPGGTTAVEFLSRASGNDAMLLRSIVVANVTSSAAKYSIYLDLDGTTYDQGTALFREVSLPANESDIIDFEGDPVSIDGSTSIGVQTDTASALTFTALKKAGL